jgi:hypothetical protein
MVSIHEVKAKFLIASELEEMADRRPISEIDGINLRLRIILAKILEIEERLMRVEEAVKK